MTWLWRKGQIDVGQPAIELALEHGLTCADEGGTRRLYTVWAPFDQLMWKTAINVTLQGNHSIRNRWHARTKQNRKHAPDGCLTSLRVCSCLVESREIHATVNGKTQQIFFWNLSQGYIGLKTAGTGT